MRLEVIVTEKSLQNNNYEELEELLKENGHNKMVMPQEGYDGDIISAITNEDNVLIKSEDENILCIMEDSYCLAVTVSEQSVAIATGEEIVISEGITINNYEHYARDAGDGLFGGIKEYVSFDILVNGTLFKRMEVSKNADIVKNAVSALVKEIMGVKYPHIDGDDSVTVWETKQQIKENLSEEIREVIKKDDDEEGDDDDFSSEDLVVNGVYTVQSSEPLTKGSKIVIVNSNCEFTFDSFTGSFSNDPMREYEVDVEIISRDFSDYIPEKSNNGGCYAFAEAVVREIISDDNDETDDDSRIDNMKYYFVEQEYDCILAINEEDTWSRYIMIPPSFLNFNTSHMNFLKNVEKIFFEDESVDEVFKFINEEGKSIDCSYDEEELFDVFSVDGEKVPFVFTIYDITDNFKKSRWAYIKQLKEAMGRKGDVNVLEKRI